MTFKFAELAPVVMHDRTERCNRAIMSRPLRYGIGIESPRFIRGLLGNIARLEARGSGMTTAIQAACEVDLPPSNATLVTEKLDIGALGAMAVLEYRSSLNGASTSITNMLYDPMVALRLNLIAEVDQFIYGSWRSTPLPSSENPWLPGAVRPSYSPQLAAIDAHVDDRSVPLINRVQAVTEWLLYGTVDSYYCDKAWHELKKFIAALENGSTTTEVDDTNRYVVVHSSHPKVKLIGFSLAPVVIAFNPLLRAKNGQTYSRHTVAQFAHDYIDIWAIADEINKIEQGWTASPKTLQSPRYVNTTMTIDQVVAIVSRHLL